MINEIFNGHISISLTRYASGNAVILITSQPWLVKNFDSAFVENLGPLITTTVPCSWIVIPNSFPVLIANCLSSGQYVSAADGWVTIGPSKNVVFLPSVQSTNWSQITKSPGFTCFCKLPAAQGDITLSQPTDFIAQTLAL